MFHFFHKPRTPEELQRERIAQEAKQLKEDLRRMTPEERAKFLADIDGGSPKGDSQTGDGKKR